MHPLDDLTFYSTWLTYGSRLMYPYLLERVMRQFRYMQVVPSEPFMPVSPTMARRGVDAMYDDFLII